MGSNTDSKWIDVKDRMPDHNSVFPKKPVYVLIFIDYTEYGRNEQRIEKASVPEARQIGG